MVRMNRRTRKRANHKSPNWNDTISSGGVKECQEVRVSLEALADLEAHPCRLRAVSARSIPAPQDRQNRRVQRKADRRLSWGIKWVRLKKRGDGSRSRLEKEVKDIAIWSRCIPHIWRTIHHEVAGESVSPRWCIHPMSMRILVRSDGRESTDSGGCSCTDSPRMRIPRSSHRNPDWKWWNGLCGERTAESMRREIVMETTEERKYCICKLTKLHSNIVVPIRIICFCIPNVVGIVCSCFVVGCSG